MTKIQSRIIRSGFTIVEVLTSIGIVGLVTAIVIPAVQHARATARLAMCRNHLHQLGVALGNACEADGKYPTSPIKGPPIRRLLPYLDSKTLAADLEAGREPASFTVQGLACPNDLEALQSMPLVGNSSYYFNQGVKFRSYDGFRKGFDTDLSPADIQDGLSQTVAMSERLVFPTQIESPDVQARDVGRYFWWTKTRHGPGEEAQAVADCQNNRTTTTPQMFGIQAWGYRGNLGYNHLLTPNQHSCYNGPESMDVFQFDLILAPASSLHSNGVNSLFADGSVQFTSNDVDANVWQAIGTRAGHELVSVP